MKQVGSEAGIAMATARRRPSSYTLCVTSVCLRRHLYNWHPQAQQLNRTWTQAQLRH